MTKPRFPLDRSVAFTLLLEYLPGYAESTSEPTDPTLDRFLDDWYAAPGTDMGAFARTWRPTVEWGDLCPNCDQPYPFLYGPHPTWVPCEPSSPIEGERINEVDTGRTYRWTGTAWQPTEGDDAQR